jgi:hypothetical protein
MREERLGSGIKDCWCGRRNWMGSVRLYFTMWFWRLIMRINGFSSWTWLQATECVVHIISSLGRNHTILLFIWHTDVSLKVSLFAWRLLRKSVKDNFFRQDIIPHDSQLCVSGCGNYESSNNLLLSFDNFGSPWHLVHNWLVISLVDPFEISYHFL